MAKFLLTLLALVTTVSAADPPPEYTYNNYSYLDGCQGFDCLEKYVQHPDPAYTWKDTGLRLNGTGLFTPVKWTGYILNFTSQTWLTPADSSRSVWWHLMVVIVPDNFNSTDAVTNHFGSMYMTGSCNTNGPPKSNSEDVLVAAYLATHTATITSALFQIPACPVLFATDPIQKERTEDAIIAFTWQHFVEKPTEPQWLLRLPMTKAGVRGLDTLSSFVNTLYPNVHLDNFAVAGASKRGWNTWTVAAVDKRVKAAIPIVMDIWHMVKNLHHHYKAYGGWTFAFKDYWALNFTKNLDAPNTKLMAQIIDPTNYPKDRANLNIPKLAINSCMDEFLLPDDTTFWWDEMQGQNNFLIIPNAEHSEATGVLELLPAISTFLRGVVRGEDATSRPIINWTIAETTGDIVVKQMSDHIPIKVTMWHATSVSSERRDFRVINGANKTQCSAQGGIFVKNMCANIKSFWSRTTLEKGPDGTWTAHRDVEKDGKWTAFFVHMEYEGPKQDDIESGPAGRRRLDWPISEDGRYQMTTTVSIIPQTFPFPDCHGDGCLGELV